VRDGFVFNPDQFFSWSGGNGWRSWAEKLGVNESKN
jgi:hypothetical protein